jgi:hypothetical protein
MEWVEILGVAAVLFLLLALAARYMARATTSTNMAWLTGAAGIFRKGRRPPPPWISDALHGELGDERPERREEEE